MVGCPLGRYLIRTKCESGASVSFWPSDAAGWATVLGVPLTVLSIMLGVLVPLLMKAIEDEPSRRRLAALLDEESPWARYRDLLKGGLARLDRFFGRPWSWRAFDRCLLLAFVYPAAFLLSGWAFGGTISFSSDASQTRGLLSLSALFVVMLYPIIAMRVVSRSDILALQINDRLFGPATRRLGTIALYLAITAGAIIGTFFAIAFGVGAGGLPVIPAATLGVAVVVAASGIAGSLAIVSALLLASIGFAEGDSVLGWLVATLWAFLPLLNAAMDWPSWAVSRQLALHLVDPATMHGNAWRWLARTGAMGHLLLDLLLAFGFLFALAALLPVSVQAINAIFANDTVLVVWAPMLETARQAPWNAGLGVTLMLITTLLPTGLHAGVGLFALLVRPMPGHGWVLRRLREPEPIMLHRAGIALWLLTFALGSLCLVLVAGWLLWLGLSMLTGETTGTMLLDTACWSARLVGGPGLPQTCVSTG